MELPRNIVIGHDALLAVGEVCQALKLGKKALIVADENTIKIAGKTVEKELTGRKIRHSEYLIPDATWEEVRDGEERIRKGDFEFAIGVGGGRSIDVAKCASFNAGVPFVSVPTAASHDGVVSSRAAIQKGGEKVSIGAQTPIAVIMDTGVIAESPFRLLASGCGDIISNLAAVKDWALARNLRNEYFSSYAAALSELAARLVIENASTIKPRLEESAWFVCKALVSSGVAMSIAGSSRPASGSEHKFSHALDRIAKKPGLHGEQCGVGTIMMMYLHSGNWQEVRDALLAIGAPRPHGLSGSPTTRSSRPSCTPTRSTRNGTRFSGTRDSPSKRRSASRKSRRSSSSVCEDSESVARRDDSIGVGLRIDRQTVPTEIIPKCLKPVNQRVPRLCESEPWDPSRPVDANRVRKITEIWPALEHADSE